MLLVKSVVHACPSGIFKVHINTNARLIWSVLLGMGHLVPLRSNLSSKDADVVPELRPVLALAASLCLG